MVRTIPYGASPEQVGDLWLPDGDDPGPAGFPAVAIYHGGGYVPEVTRVIMEGVANDLRARGIAAWNLEYRRIGSGGGWPQTFADAADGLDRLATIDDAPLDLDRVATLGFSAGGPLALWAAGRGDAAVKAKAAVSQAGVVDLDRVARDPETDCRIVTLMGDPDEHRADYARANPAERLPLGVPLLIVHGDADENVPLSLQRDFVERARAAGDDVELEVVPGANHFAHNDPGSEAWRVAREWIQARLGA
jgi:acetyl esterase/lipase